MALTLYAHPFSSYSQKVLIVLYENAIPFTYRVLSPEDPQAGVELQAHWPMNRFPLLVDEGQPIAEASIIIEHLEIHHAGPVRFIPRDPRVALEVRFMDRFFDNFIMTPMQKIVLDHLRATQERDPRGVADARTQLEVAYRWLDERMAGRDWAVDCGFSLADCAAGPSLFYADWVHPMDAALSNARAYRARLLAQRSFARAVDEARPYRRFFPPGAPDRD
jgi:glutathione S-transferase